MSMDKFDYYMEFMSMRLDDPQFRLMYGINGTPITWRYFHKNTLNQWKKTNHENCTILVHDIPYFSLCCLPCCWSDVMLYLGIPLGSH